MNNKKILIHLSYEKFKRQHIFVVRKSSIRLDLNCAIF